MFLSDRGDYISPVIFFTVSRKFLLTLRSVAQGKNLGSFTAKQDDDTQSKINARFERIVEQGKMDEIQRRLKRELERFK